MDCGEHTLCQNFLIYPHHLPGRYKNFNKWLMTGGLSILNIPGWKRNVSLTLPKNLIEMSRFSSHYKFFIDHICIQYEPWQILRCKRIKFCWTHIHRAMGKKLIGWTYWYTKYDHSLIMRETYISATKKRDIQLQDLPADMLIEISSNFFRVWFVSLMSGLRGLQRSLLPDFVEMSYVSP